MTDRALLKLLFKEGNFFVSVKNDEEVDVSTVEEDTLVETKYGDLGYNFYFTISKREFVDILREIEVNSFTLKTTLELKGTKSNQFLHRVDVEIEEDFYDKFANNEKIHFNIDATTCN